MNYNPGYESVEDSNNTKPTDEEISNIKKSDIGKTKGRYYIHMPQVSLWIFFKNKLKEKSILKKYLKHYSLTNDTIYTTGKCNVNI